MNRIIRVSFCPGLVLSLGALLVGGAASAAAPPPPPLPAVGKALAGLKSFQVDYKATSTQKPPSIASTTYVVLRSGGLRIDRVMAMRPSGAGDTTVIEDVVSGARDCQRYPLTAPFACTKAPKLAADIAAEIDPSQAFTVKGASVQFHPAGAKTVGGVACAGYAFTLRTPSEHGKGTLYVAPRIGLPCEEDATIVGPAIGPAPAGATQTLNVTWTWHRFNDPKLKIPAVPNP